MRKVTAEQQMELLFRLSRHTSWDELTSEEVQKGIDFPENAGRGFTTLIRNGFRTHIGDYFRVAEDLSIKIPALPRPTLEELRKKFPWIQESDGIVSDTSPTGPTELILGTVLLPDEEGIGGTEYERRRTLLRGRMYGLQQFEWLVKHQDEHPAFMALLGKIYADGPGLIVVSADGDRRFPYLDQGGARWCLVWRLATGGLYRGGRVAASSKPH